MKKIVLQNGQKEEIDMVEQTKIRPSKELVELINFIRSKCLVYHGKTPSITKITEVIAKKINKEKLWQDEFNDKQKSSGF